MKASANLREMRNTGDGRDFPVAEVTGKDEHALALRARRDERLDVVDADRPRACRAAHEAKPQEFAREPPQVRVMRLREGLDLVDVERHSVDALQVLQHDS